MAEPSIRLRLRAGLAQLVRETRDRTRARIQRRFRSAHRTVPQGATTAAACPGHAMNQSEGTERAALSPPLDLTELFSTAQEGC